MENIIQNKSSLKNEGLYGRAHSGANLKFTIQKGLESSIIDRFKSCLELKRIKFLTIVQNDICQFFIF